MDYIRQWKKENKCFSRPKKMRTNVNDVKDWIEELKKRGIKEFQFRNLPNDLKIIGIIRKASAIGKIEEKEKIKSIITWNVK